MEKRYPKTVMATACVPWDKDYNFDEKTFREEVDMLLSNKIRSIYLFGTAGEGHMVSNRQFLDITKAFLDEMKRVPDSLPMVGVISMSAPEIIDRIEAAYNLGARDFQISFPSWGALSDSEAHAFMHQICDRFPDCRFMHYNNGPRAKKKLGAAHYVRLCEEIPNLVAVKNPTGMIPEMHELMDADLPLQFYFLEMGYGYASQIGECGLLISILNLNYEKAWEYFDIGLRKDAAGAVRMHSEFKRCHNALFDAVPGGMIDAAYDKLFVKKAVPNFSQRLYPPYQGATDEQYEQFIAVLKETMPEWVR